MPIEISAVIGMMVSFVFVCGAALAIRRAKKQIGEMSEVLEDVKKGNGNRRVLADPHELAAPLLTGSTILSCPTKISFLPVGGWKRQTGS